MELIASYKEAAGDYQAVMTGGSDFHGDNKRQICMGEVDVPEWVLTKLLAAVED